ncbi:MAG: alkaline phosphatase D family protein, partial [Acidobacteriota bacterium]|nr:alkaline phosphatase D family protein [Acidobacteriota bacterium]
MNRRSACKLLSSAPVVASGALAAPAGDPVRPWIGPEFWSNPLQDWQFSNNRMECIVSGSDRHVYLLTRELSERRAKFSLRVKTGRIEEDRSPLSTGFAGFRIGIKGTFHDYRDSAIYGLGLNAGILADGKLFIGEPDPGSAGVTGFPRPLELVLEGEPAGSGYRLRLSALDDQGRPLASVSRDKVDAASVHGGIAVVCSAGSPSVSQDESSRQTTMSGFVMPHRAKEGNWRFWFRDLQLSGDKLDAHPDRAFGPILWAMYTVTRDVLKLTAQMAPVGERSEPVRLEIQRAGRWQPAASARIDPLARTATFRLPGWKSSEEVKYRVAYQLEGEQYFEGTIRKDPVNKPKISVAVLSCLNDFGFPHSDLLRSLQHFEPDLLAFEGDQIYERTASYGIERLPVERAALDYLRKWFLFGWSFRDLMRNTPVICMPDDHDVYHGNVWGAGGRHAEGTGQAGQDSGGYLEPATWVNMVQRTQTSHLPDPFDPTPVEQGIGVYYTDLHWGGVSFAILEDRKWKSAPKVTLPAAKIVNGWAQNPEYKAARDGNAPGAQLLGERQLTFLNKWAQDWRGGIWMKAVFSQTLFANVATLPPPANTDAVCPKLPIMKPGEYPEGDIVTADHDSNGWPQAGRDQALRAFRRCSAVHLCGDQHIGSTVQYGIEKWNDAPFALCSPALSNLFPRRWFPAQGGANPLPYSPRNTGQFLDGFGNKITVHAVFNPRQMDAKPNPLMDRSPGIALVEFDHATREITLSVWPRRHDPTDPKTTPVSGWPVKIHQLDNGWSSAAWVLPVVQARGLRDFCVQVIRD